jgi:hypothetical protein
MRAVWLSIATSGCGLYLGDKPCVPAPTVSVFVRDPATGGCEETTPPDEVADTCGKGIATPAGFPSCDGECEGLGEAACLANALCHPEYKQTLPGPGPGNGGGTGPVFDTCWDITPLHPTSVPDCTAVTAEHCARVTNCGTEIQVESDGTFGEARCIALPGAVP